MALSTTALALGALALLGAQPPPAQRAVLRDAPPPLIPAATIDLPAGDRPFPAGPNVGVVSANCVTCHSSGMILNQPGLTPATWEAEVNKMINVYKAPVAKADVPAIVAYLSAVKGP